MDPVAEPDVPRDSQAKNKRSYRSAEERRRIVEETLVPGTSVAKVARAHGINANQVFAWRKLHLAGKLRDRGSKRVAGTATGSLAATTALTEAVTSSVRLLPVSVSAEVEQPASATRGPPHGDALGISRFDRAYVARDAGSHQRPSRCRSAAPGAGVLVRMISVPANTRIWIAAGVTDLRRGFTGLSALVQTALNEDPLSGHVFVFRGRRGDLIKILWFDGDGLCLFAKRLERGRFVWPTADSRTVALTHGDLPVSDLIP